MRLLLIFGIVPLLVLPLADPAEAAPVVPAPGQARFPLPSLDGLRAKLHAQTWTGLPVQHVGTPSRDHTPVAGTLTHARGGAGHKPGKGAGALAADKPYQPQAVPGKSGRSGGSRFDAKTSVMDPARSSATVTQFRNADGSITRNVAQHPVNYQRDKGRWSPIETSLAKTAQGRYAEKANSLGVSFAAAASDATDLVTVSASSTESVGFGLSGAAASPAEVDGSTVTYPGVLPGTDLVETAGPTGAKEAIVLAKPPSGHIWTFDLHTQGLSAAVNRDGSVEFTDPKGTVAGRIPPAFAYDSKVDPGSGDPATTWDVTYGLTGAGGDYRLTVAVDAAWLSDPARAYPVTIDPTLTLGTAGTVSTTYVSTDKVFDYSADTTIKTGDCVAKNCGGTESNAVGLIKFPTFPDGQGYGISAASLHLFDTWTASTSGTPDCVSTNPNVTWSTINVAPITQAWSVPGAKAYPGPAHGAVIGSAAPATWNACQNTGGVLTKGDWVSVPITNLDFLNNWSYNAEPDYGLAISAATGSLTWRKFDSDVESAQSPYLSVTYSDHAPQVNSQFPPNGFDPPTLTPELLASATKPADSTSTAALTYDFVVVDASGTAVADSGKLTKGDYLVPAGKLKWGQTYYWSVSANDGTLNSVAPPIRALSPEVPQPLITSTLSQTGDEHGFDQTTGNYTTEAKDADVDTTGPSLQVVRDYNARDPRTTGAFGAAWSSVFDARATEQVNPGGAVTSVLVNYPDGSQVGFGKNADGSFSPPSGRFAMLRAVTGGGYTLTDKDDTVYTFSQSLGAGAYGIASVADASKRTVTFTRAGGNVTAMTSSVSGRTLHLTWSTPDGATSPHVATVFTDPVAGTDQNTDLTWKYWYTGDRLATVCDPAQAGNCADANAATATKYGYIDGSQGASAVLDAGVHSFWPLSDASGSATAASAVLSNEQNDVATYHNVSLGAAGPFPGSTATAGSFDGTSSSLVLPHNLVGGASYQSIGLWFKTTSPGVLLSYQSDGLTAGATTTGNYVPAMYVGTSGKLNAQLWNGNLAPIQTPAAVADGKWHYALLSGAGNTQSLYLDGAFVASKAGIIAPYKDLGTENQYVGGGYWGGAWPDEPHFTTGGSNTGYASYFAGTIADVQFFTQPLVQADLTGLETAATHPASLLTKITRPSGKTFATVAYDTATSRVSSVVDENGGTWKLNAPTVTGSSDGYRAAVLGSGPAGYYRLGETGGASDAVSEVNTATGGYHNVTLGAPGPFADRTAAGFDGTSSYVSLPAGDTITSGPNSIELWFTMKAGSTDGGVLFDEMGQPITSATPEASGWVPAMYVGTDGRLHGSFWVGNTASTMVSGSLVNDGKWHHAVLAAGTRSQTLYLDGTSVGTSNAALVPLTGLTNLYLGAGESNGAWPFHPTNTLGYFPGSIAEFGFYRGQLTADQVTAHYAAYSSGVSGVTPTQINTVVDPRGNTLTYRYDAQNGDRLLSETDAAGQTTSYGYDTSGFLYTTTDPNGNVTTTAHDVRGNTVSQTDCQNQAAQACSTEYFTYWPDDTTAILATADPRNDLMTSFRDGRSASATDSTYATTYAYDAAGNRTAVNTSPVPGSPSGRSDTVTYSDGTAAFPAADSGNVPAGLPMTETTAGGALSRIAYLHNGDVAATTDEDGLVTLYRYDGVGRVVGKTVAPGAPTGWWKLNQTTGTTVADSSGVGNAATATGVTWSGGVGAFNGTSSQVVTKAPVVNTDAGYTLSAWAKLTAVPASTEVVVGAKGVNATSAELTYSPVVKAWKFQTSNGDITGRVETLAAPAATPTAGTWYHLAGVYDAASRHMTLYVNGQPAGQADAPGTWNGAKVLSIGSANGSAFFNGSIGNVQVYQRPLSDGDVKTLYDAGVSGSAVSTTSPNGLVTTIGYDAAGQVVTQTDPTVTNRVTGAAHTATTTTGYDPDGDITSQKVADSAAGGDAARTVSNTYNAYDQLATSTDGNGHTTAKTYGPAGDLLTETSPNGDVTAYTYDGEGRMLTQALTNYTGDPANPIGARSQLQISRVYDKAGRLYSLTDAMNNATTYTYTDNGLVASVTRSQLDAGGKPVSSYVMETDSYDAAGNQIGKVSENGSITATKSVDAADRTTKVTVDPTGVARSTSISYTPDDDVATTSEKDKSGWDRTTSFTYDGKGNAQSQSVGLDATGHPVGWWRLNQTSGSVVTDASGTGNLAAATGVTWSGTGATFSGAAGQQIATNGPVVATTAPYSVSAWVNLSAVPTATEGVVSQDGTTNSGFSLQYNATDGGWAFAQTASDTSGAATVRAKIARKPAANTWYHLVGTYDSATGAMKVYVNNSATPGTAGDTTPFPATGGLVIGRDKAAGAATDRLAGTVTNVQVYDRVLSAADVTKLFQAGSGGGTVASSALNTTRWTRDARGLPVLETDPNGNVTTYGYDEAGHLAVTVSPPVSAETYGSAAAMVRPVTTDGYDAFGEETQTQDANGNITNTVYDAEGNTVSKTLPAYTPPGASAPIVPTTVWKYDKEDNLLSEQDPLLHTTEYTYDQMGDVATEKDPGGGITHHTYDLNGEQLSVTDPEGAQSQATYDFLGRQVTASTLERYPTAHTLTTTYSYAASAADPGGANLASTTSPDGAVTSYGYDFAGQHVSTVDPAGNTTRYAYTFLGDPYTTTNPDGTSSEVDYDANQQVTDVVDHDAKGTALTRRHMSYDAAGNLLASTDPNGHTTTYTYDATGMVTSAVQPVSATKSMTVSFGYDAAGNRTRYTDGRNTNWFTAYNAWGLPDSEIEPATSTYSTAGNSTTTYAYDADAQLATKTLPGGVTQGFTYDKLGDLLTQSGSGASAGTAERTFTYDKAGRMLTAATSDTSTDGVANDTSESATYDDRGDLLTASGTAGATTLGYNGDGLLTSRADASGTTSYGYNGADQLDTVSDASTGMTQTYHYNPMNQVSSINEGAGGDVRSFGYDDLHRLTSDTVKTPGGAAVSSIGYGWDNDGNLTSKNTTGFGAAASNTYGYDWANRLTSWNNGSKVVDYGYDDAGNRTQVGANVYTYDARDQLTSDGVNSYSYTAAGVLSSQSSTGGGTTAYTSDAYGQQIAAGSVRYTYDALGRVVQRKRAGTATNLQYSGTDNQVAADGQFQYSRNVDGSVVGLRAAGAAASTGQLVVTDLHSDVVGTLGSSSAVLTGTATYDPLGNVVGTKTTAGNLGYQSEYTDPTTSQVNMAARWYNPAVGQFTSKDTFETDPAANPAAANPFAYIGDNPMVGTDPSGHCSWYNVVCGVKKAASGVSSAVSIGARYVQDDIIRPAMSVYRAYVAPVVRAAVHRAKKILHRVNDVYHHVVHTFKRYVSRQYHRARAAVHRVLHAAAHVVKTAYHAVKRAAKATGRAVTKAAKATGHAVVSATKASGKYLKSHAAAITSLVVSTVVFAGCEAALTAGSAGTLSVPGAIACGAAAGAAAALVEQGFKCGSGQKGACSLKSFATAGIEGGAAGALGGVLGGLGGKLLGKVAPKALDALGGLFGRGSSEVAEAGANDAVDSAAESEGRSAASQASHSSADDPAEAAATSERPTAGRESGSGCRAGAGVPHSFAGETPVMMAGGATKAIDQVKAGDQVANAAPGQMGTEIHTVERVIVTTTDHDFVDVAVAPRVAASAGRASTRPAFSGRTGGRTVKRTDRVKAAAVGVLGVAVVAAGAGVLPVPAEGGTVTTTYYHPFYDITRAAFVEARDLAAGDVLQTPTGTASVIGVRLYHASRTTYDLTIDGLHTYYVLAATTPILVHNCNETFATRAEAKNAAYARAGIPRDSNPDATWTVGDDVTRQGQPDYRFDSNPGSHGNYEQFETENGSRMVVEHNNDPNAPLPHFHAGQPKGDPSRNFVNLGHDVYDQSGPFERYSPVGGAHHLYYEAG